MMRHRLSGVLGPPSLRKTDITGDKMRDLGTTWRWLDNGDLFTETTVVLRFVPSRDQG